MYPLLKYHTEQFHWPKILCVPPNLSDHWLFFFFTVSIFAFSSMSYKEGNGTPLQYSCLENSMDGGAWKAAVHGVVKSQTWLSNFTFSFHFHALEKEMATHSRVLVWRIPGTVEPGGLPSMGSHKVGHNWVTNIFTSFFARHTILCW